MAAAGAVGGGWGGGVALAAAGAGDGGGGGGEGAPQVRDGASGGEAGARAGSAGLGVVGDVLLFVGASGGCCRGAEGEAAEVPLVYRGGLGAGVFQERVTDVAIAGAFLVTAYCYRRGDVRLTQGRIAAG